MSVIVDIYHLPASICTPSLCVFECGGGDGLRVSLCAWSRGFVRVRADFLPFASLVTVCVRTLKEIACARARPLAPTSSDSPICFDA